MAYKKHSIAHREEMAKKAIRLKNEGKTIKEAADELDCPYYSLIVWVREYKNGSYANAPDKSKKSTYRGRPAPNQMKIIAICLTEIRDELFKLNKTIQGVLTD